MRRYEHTGLGIIRKPNGDFLASVHDDRDRCAIVSELEALRERAEKAEAALRFRWCKKCELFTRPDEAAPQHTTCPSCGGPLVGGRTPAEKAAPKMVEALRRIAEPGGGEALENLSVIARAALAEAEGA